MSYKKLPPVYIIDGNRTPFIKSSGKPNSLLASDLAVAACQPLLLRQPFPAVDIDEVVVGCVAPSVDEANIGRIIARRLGLPYTTPGYTVQRNCASGLQAIDSAAKDIMIGRSKLVLAGGTEAMSRIPLIFDNKMAAFLADLAKAKTPLTKLKTIAKFRPSFLKPIIGILRGLSDTTVGMNMGQTAEKLASQFDISRLAMDEFAVRSHKRAYSATESKIIQPEMTPLYDRNGQVISFDNGIRADSCMEKLAKLRPVFEGPFGLVTAGNSSQITDGAAFVLLASEDAVSTLKLKPKAKIVATTWSGLDPTIMGLGPAHAIVELLQSTRLSVDDIDFWEINEAFAGQVLACTKAIACPKFCSEYFGLKKAYNPIPDDRLNVEGGAIAVGHPVGASGSRIVLHLMNKLQQSGAKRAIASLCIGGGQGGAILIESM